MSGKQTDYDSVDRFHETRSVKDRLRSGCPSAPVFLDTVVVHFSNTYVIIESRRELKSPEADIYFTVSNFV